MASKALKLKPLESALLQRARTSASIARLPETAPSATGMVRVLTCGSVDDGKSTLIGRLLWDAAELPDDTRAAIGASAGSDGVPDVSLLLDGLEAERAQGITIDIAWRYFDIAARRYVFIDCPGHEQYTRNMATGASQAEVAVMLVDARQGLKRQTRRHAAILELVGIRSVILIVNKMDLVGWSQDRFESIAGAFSELASRSGFGRAVAIPVAARFGENVARVSPEMPWFKGPTLLAALDQAAGGLRREDSPFRFPVQTVLRDGKGFRGLAGTIASGRIRRGDEIVEALSGRRARVSRITTFNGDLDNAGAGKAVVIGLDTDLDIGRGGLLAPPQFAATATRQIDARLVWLGDLAPGPTGLLLRTATDLVPVADFSVSKRLDFETLGWRESKGCGVNDIVDARISLGRSAALDVFADHRGTGQFVLVDALSGATVAGGVVTSVKAPTSAVSKSAFRLSRALLASTVCADLTDTDGGRQEFRRRAAEVAILMGAAGVSVDLEDLDKVIGEA
jgi:bifunctional enzyme CysN/CysC